MLVRQPPIEVEVSHTVCGFHQRNPGKPYPGCTCSGAYVARTKPMEDWTEEEKRRYFDFYGDFE